ncbi:MAG: sugar transferase [Verrucomicrobiales bacterium]
MDFVIVILSLPFWLPLCVLTVLWVKLSSRGPLLFCQNRIGQGGQPFKMFKFRSMHPNAETDVHEQHFEQLVKSNKPMTKLDALGDSRLIPGGAWLRAFCLDELPQILNVVRGEMSIVGPRPCTPREFGLYTEQQKERVCIHPGLTGLWQVEGKNKTTFEEMIALDIEYGRAISVGRDLSIIACTIPAIVSQLRESRKKAKALEKPLRVAKESHPSKPAQKPGDSELYLHRTGKKNDSPKHTNVA